jgi:hypothetical protein
MCKDICRWAVCFILVSCCSLTPLKADEYERQSLRKWSHIVRRLPNFFVHRNMLFWGITQWVAIILYRRFRTTYWSHLQGSRVQTLPDLDNSYVPEGLAQVEFCVSQNWVHIWSTIYIDTPRLMQQLYSRRSGTSWNWVTNMVNHICTHKWV